MILSQDFSDLTDQLVDLFIGCLMLGGHFTSFGLSFLVCEMGVIIHPPPEPGLHVFAVTVTTISPPLVSLVKS